MTPPLLELIHVSKSFTGKQVLRDISLPVFAHQSMAIVGDNGCGKSTLLRIVGGFTVPTQGSRHIGVANRGLKIGYVPDRFPKLRFTPQEYLFAMGRLRGMAEADLGNRVDELLSRFGLYEARNRRLTGFSKGMLQKVNIMQSILEIPELLLLDEPLSGLDKDSQTELIWLLQMLKNEGLTVVMTSHEVNLVEIIADEIVTIHDGRIASESNVMTPSPSIVVIHVILPSGEENVVENYPEVLGIGIDSSGMTTLKVSKDDSNNVLRMLLAIEGASVVSLSPLDISAEEGHQ